MQSNICISIRNFIFTTVLNPCNPWKNQVHIHRTTESQSISKSSMFMILSSIYFVYRSRWLWTASSLNLFASSSVFEWYSCMHNKKYRYKPLIQKYLVLLTLTFICIKNDYMLETTNTYRFWTFKSGYLWYKWRDYSKCFIKWQIVSTWWRHIILKNKIIQRIHFRLANQSGMSA